MQKDFEKEYYEAERFWETESLSDENNINRIQETIRIIPVSCKNIADIGCGNGIFINKLRRERPNISTLAIDRSKAALRYVDGDKREGNINNIDLPDNSFDCVSCLEVIEHLPVGIYEQAISELCRISKQYLIVSVPYDEDLEMDSNQCPNCKSIFNANLHLRNYSKESFIELFEKYNFKCVEHKLLGKSLHYKFHNYYRKIFYPKQLKQWKSPICPICGYESTNNETNIVNRVNNKYLSVRVIRYLSYFPKTFWPKEEKYYWILGLFEKSK